MVEILTMEKKGKLEKTLIFFIGFYLLAILFKNFISDKYGTILSFSLSVIIFFLLFTIWRQGIREKKRGSEQ